MLPDFFLDFARDVDAIWSQSRLAEFADRSYPYATLSRAHDIIRADAYLQWITWYAEGIVDPMKFAGRYDAYPIMFELCLRFVSERFSELTADESRKLSSSIAKYLQRRVDILTSAAVRQKLSRDQKYELVVLAGNPARCWITGRPFSDSAIQHFLEGPSGDDYGRSVVERPMYVDIYRPIGIHVRDLQIEIDHMIPISRGGDIVENLRISCGWANSAKSNYIGLYDCSGGVRDAKKRDMHHRVPPSLPQPFWVIRLLATRRRCEHPAGCNATSVNSELTVALITSSGAPTPTNLRVVCSEHDPIASNRYLPRNVVEAAWS